LTLSITALDTVMPSVVYTGVANKPITLNAVMLSVVAP